MALADLDRVKKRIIAILNANPSAYAATVSGDVGSFPHDQEITDAIFQAEAEIVKAYLNSVNPHLAAGFTVTSGNLSSGDLVPEIRGNHYVVELSENEATWIKGIEAMHIDDVVNLARHSDYIETGAGRNLYKFDGGRFYSPAAYGRVKSSTYAKTSALQINEMEEYLLVCTAVRFLTKHASPVPFEHYVNESVRGIQQLIQDGVYTQQQQGQ